MKINLFPNHDSDTLAQIETDVIDMAAHHQKEIIQALKVYAMQIFECNRKGYAPEQRPQVIQGKIDECIQILEPFGFTGDVFAAMDEFYDDLTWSTRPYAPIVIFD